MKYSLIGLSLVFSLFAFAGDTLHLPGPGKLSFSGRVSYEWKRVNEVVVTLSENSKNRLRDLQTQNFVCEYKGRETFLCSKLITEGLALDSDLKRMAEKFFRQQEIEFARLSGNPAQVVKGESYEEYSIPQGVRVNDAIYPSYRYAILNGILHKIVFGQPAQSGLVVLNDGSYELLHTVNRTVSKNVFEQHGFGGQYR